MGPRFAHAVVSAHIQFVIMAIADRADVRNLVLLAPSQRRAFKFALRCMLQPRYFGRRLMGVAGDVFLTTAKHS